MRRALVAFIAAATVASFVPAAHALSILHCGQTVKKSITLDRNLLNCTGSGLVVGASNITIDLDGYTLGGDAKAGGVGVLNDDGFKNVTIENGTITRFDDGVRVESSGNTTANVLADLALVSNGAAARFTDANANRLTDSDLRGNKRGVVISADRNVVEHSTITDKPAVSIEGDGNKIEGNDVANTHSTTVPSSLRATGDGNAFRRNNVTGGSVGVSVNGNRNAIERNDLFRGARTGIVVLGDANKVVRNDVSSYAGQGIWLRNEGSDTDNVAESNDVEGNGKDGILSDTDDAQLLENSVDRNRGDGLDVNGDSTLVQDNDAARNSGWGVDAGAPGVQGSDNDVRANGRGCRPARLCA